MIRNSFIILLTSLLTIACSNDRAVFLKDLGIKGKKFTDTAGEKLKQAAALPEKKTIGKDTDLPIKGKLGTEVWLTSDDLILPDGKPATYPIQVEILEVYKPKDMILNGISTVTDRGMLSTAGQIKITAFKDAKELKLSKSNDLIIAFPAANGVDQKMGLFYGVEKDGNVIKWLPADTTGKNLPLYPDRDGYTAFPSQIGWINCDKLIDSPGPFTNINFVSEYPEIKNINIFLYFPDMKSVVKVNNGSLGPVPIGSKVKIIAISITDKDEWYSFLAETRVQEKQTIEIKLVSTSKDDLLKFLDSL